MEKPYRVSVNGTYEFEFTKEDVLSLDSQQLTDSTYHLLHTARSLAAEITAADFDRKSYSVRISGNLYEITIADELDQLIREMGLSVRTAVAVNEIKAPMPGLILEVNVSEGQEVKEGDYLLVLEAMKMENTIVAPRDAVVKSVGIKKGETVSKNQVLIEME